MMSNGPSGTRRSYKQQWRSALEKRLPDLFVLIEEDPLVDWIHKDSVPVAVIPAALHRGLDILYSGLDDVLGMRYVQKCADMIGRVERESNVLALRDDRESIPRGEVLLCKAFSAGILHEQLDYDSLRRSAEEFVGWIFDRQPHGWEDMYQSFCISAVLSYLTIDELPKAAALVESVRGVRWHHPDGLPLCDLVEALHLGREIPRGVSEALWQYFEKLRAPDFNPEYSLDVWEHRVELAAVLSKYLLHGGQAFQWRSLIDLISR